MKVRVNIMSKYMKQEERASIPKHRHCVVCSTPVSMDKEFCGPNCEDQFKRGERKRKYTFIAILLLFPVLFLVLTLLRR
jgi:predicted nucleic acid-binding Zn ribbon protein